MKVASSRKKGGAAAHAGSAGLGLAALGVVFGDIGTSPLYVLRTVFTLDGGAVRLDEDDITGVISCIIWVLVLIVTVKYVCFVLRADNEGEGGILALATRVRRSLNPGRIASAVALLGVFGAALFFGDSVITPAISVLSAVEGLEVTFPHMAEYVVPAALAILSALFLAQRKGTSKMGKVFGPIMLAWFGILACMGIPHIVGNPRILVALSPVETVSFISRHPGTTFVALGAIVLAVTGAEALYADIAHFGRRAIQGTWLAVVLPSLTLCYLGQGALLIDRPQALSNPFFMLVPSSLTVPLVFMATLATLIASQAVISGAYSIARQASHLGYLPHMKVKHTSATESGQIYLPAVNLLLFASVASIILIFQDSERLSAAYGLAVTTDFLLTTSLLLLLTRAGWRWPAWATGLAAAVLLAVELPLFAANVTKIATGGWLPLLIATFMLVVMTTWRRGEELVTHSRRAGEGSLSEYLRGLASSAVRRIPGTAIYPHSMLTTTPLALKKNTEINRVLHDNVVIVSIKTLPTPHVPRSKRVVLDEIASPVRGVTHLTVRYGFMDERDLTETIRHGQRTLKLSWKLDDEAFFMLSHIHIVEGSKRSMWKWRKKLFIGLSRVSASPSWVNKLPKDRTAEISMRVLI